MGEKNEDNWVVRLVRYENEDKWYFIDKKGNINARLSSAMRYTKEVAVQFCDAINNGKTQFIATPRKLYSDGKLWHKPSDRNGRDVEAMAESVTVMILPDGKDKKGMEMITLKFKRLSPLAKLPQFAHASDSGMDISSVEDVEIPPRAFALIKTGIAVEIPKDERGGACAYEIQVRPRSGLQCKKGINFGIGTIDEGYRGEIGVPLYNNTDEVYKVSVGDRVAQLVLCPILRPLIVETKSDLGETDRGTEGFGSTGK